jgi:hypothetical protein
MKSIIVLLVGLFSVSGFSQSNAVVHDTLIYAVDRLEVQPEFPGGKETMQLYIREKLLHAGFTVKKKAKVYALFTVEKDGSLSNVKVLNKVDAGLAAALVDIMKRMPAWQPGKQNGTVVRVLDTIVVTGE